MFVGVRWEFDDGRGLNVDMSTTTLDEQWAIEIQVRDTPWVAQSNINGYTEAGVHYLTGADLSVTGESDRTFVLGDGPFPFLGREIARGHSVAGEMQISTTTSRESYELEAELTGVQAAGGDELFESVMWVTYSVNDERRIQVTLVKDLGPIEFMYYDVDETVEAEGS